MTWNMHGMSKDPSIRSFWLPVRPNSILINSTPLILPSPPRPERDARSDPSSLDTGAHTGDSTRTTRAQAGGEPVTDRVG